MSSRTALIVTLGALAVGAHLRYQGLETHDAWADEGISWTIHQSVDPVQTVRRDANGEPPLFHALLRLTAPTGARLGRLRLVPAACGVLTLLLWSGLLWRTLGPRAAAIGTPMLALSAFHVFYSQELRAYALLALLGAVVFFLLLELARRGRLAAVGWVLLAVAEALLVYAHYLSVFFLFGLAVAVLSSARLRASAGPWTICQLAGAAMVAPWVSVMAGCYLGAEQARMIVDVQPHRDTLAPLAILVLGRSVVPGSEGALSPLAWGAIGLAGLLALGFLTCGAHALHRRARGVEALLAVCAVALPIAALVAFSLAVVPAFNYIHTKYAIWALVPLLWLGTAWLDYLVEHGSARIALLLFLTYAAVNGWGVWNYRHNPEYLKAPAYRELAERLEGAVRPGDEVVYDWLGTAQALDPVLAARPGLGETPRALLAFWNDGEPLVQYGASCLDARRHRPRPCGGRRVWLVLFHDWRARSDEGFEKFRIRLARQAESLTDSDWQRGPRLSVRGLDVICLERR